MSFDVARVRADFPILSREVNAATDNPLVFPHLGEIVSGGAVASGEPRSRLSCSAPGEVVAATTISLPSGLHRGWPRVMVESQVCSLPVTRS